MKYCITLFLLLSILITGHKEARAQNLNAQQRAWISNNLCNHDLECEKGQLTAFQASAARKRATSLQPSAGQPSPKIILIGRKADNSTTTNDRQKTKSNSFASRRHRRKWMPHTFAEAVHSQRFAR